ncbi:MAG TPA: DUF4260 domain-containing protein [Paracoccus sp.]|nr:DUF4260 domain-containing protein [Paracoccus sp. (in: a-proteobacteria)]
MIGAVRWQRIEGGLILVGGLVLYGQHADVMPWWAALLAFFAPDLCMLAYGAGARAGAFVYNIVHVYAFGLAFMALGYVLASPVLAALGALWLAHSGFDRALGYGLKLPEGFSFTHLGRIGKP